MSLESDEQEQEILMRIDEGKDPTELWMIPFADLMSILVIFFLGLYALSFAQKQGRYTEALEHLCKTSGICLKPEEIAAVEDAKDDCPLPAELCEQERKSKRLTLSSEVLFRPGAAKLTPEGEASLKGIADWVAKDKFPVAVEGHTDDVPVGEKLRFKSNWELSAARAFAVIDYLSAHGVERRRLRAVGRGEFKPVAPNDTPENRAKNRRIEIALLKEAA